MNAPQNGKISMRQLMICYAFLVIASSVMGIRYLTSVSQSKLSFAVPFFCAVPIVALIFIFKRLLKGGVSLTQAIRDIGGKWLVRSYLALQIAACLICIAVYINYFADRFISSALPSAPNTLFISASLALAFLTLRGRFEYFGRFCEIAFCAFIAVFCVLCASATFRIDIENLLPVTWQDLPDALVSSPPLVQYLAVFSPVVYMADKVNLPPDAGKTFARVSLKFLTVSVLIVSVTVVITTGILGVSATDVFNYPLFAAMKAVDIFGAVEGAELVFFLIWIVVDFVYISFFAYVIIQSIQELFGLYDSKYLAAPSLFAIYAFSLCITKSRTELDFFSANIAPWIYLPFAFGIPIALLAVRAVKSLFRKRLR